MKTPFAALSLALALAAQEPSLTHGPFRGHTDTASMHVWARASAAGEFVLELTNVVDGVVATANASAAAEHDFTLHFAVAGLQPANAFAARIRRGEREVFRSGAATWSTALPDDANSATIAFGSCANDKLFPEQPIWARMLARAPNALVLLGDTPYIDVGTVPGRRQRFREFFAVPAIAAALTALPTWATWDDHDYAANDLFGAVPGSETARPVFVDYHAHAGYGDGERGIYTSFRCGPIEVFLLDTRTFADTEVSALNTQRWPGDKQEARSLLGKAQIEWLQRGLLASTAPCKVLACGMVWNGAVRAGKKDCWGNWEAERNALFGWVLWHRIEGVVLVSGDVHRSRVVLHRPLGSSRVLPELVTSPLAQNVIDANAVYVEGLAFDAGEPSSCLLLRATRDQDTGGADVRAEFLAGDGREFHVHEMRAEDLQEPNAAVGHRRVAALLRKAFGDNLEGLPPVEWSGGLPEFESARGPAWRAAVARAAPSLDEWSRVVAVPRCRFGAGRGEPGCEYSYEVGGPTNLVLVKCMQAIADNDDRTLAKLVATLLAFVRQLRQEPQVRAWRDANQIERQVVALHTWLDAMRLDRTLLVVRDAVRAHLANPVDMVASWKALPRVSQRWCDFWIEQFVRFDDRKGLAARMRAAEVRESFRSWIVPRCDAAAAVLAGKPEPALPPEAFEVDRWRVLPGLVQSPLDARGDLEPDTAALLGRRLAHDAWMRFVSEEPREYLDTLAALRKAAK